MDIKHIYIYKGGIKNELTRNIKTSRENEQGVTQEI